MKENFPLTAKAIAMIKISLIYAALLSFILVFLSVKVILGRFKNKVSLGDGGHASMITLIRTHANFTEYVPFALILIMGVEFLGYSSTVVHTLGVILILARLGHIVGMTSKGSVGPARPAGMITTFSVMIVSAILILIRSV